MQSQLTPAHYLDDSIFAREQERIFRKLWIFVGLQGLLSEPDAYLTRTIGGIPLVVQNCAGVLKAFVNQCAHRQMPLMFEAYGQGRLACKYHGWVYDAEGAVKTIPHADSLYQYPDAVRAGLCLKQFAVQTVGQLVFVNLDDTPLPITEQFSPSLLAQLEGISVHFSPQVIHATMPVRYNWKLNFENVLDSNHVAYVHPSTFRPLLDKRPPSVSAPAPDASALAETRLVDLSFSSHMPMAIAPMPWHALVDRYVDTAPADSYYNFFLYPNINFISVGGLVFLVQQFNPLAPDRTEVAFHLMTAQEQQRIPALPAILWGHLKGETRVFEEDRALLEELQSHMHAGAARAEHGAYEALLQRVAAVYLRLMGDAA
ncbi:MAG: aromatic ring-hydroxylating dioxygenase subunit alpha [Burkholderiales bacterium]|nr:aromatic ring-hydroxylating dioxygenase subunit alpha [Burkholderiales bacterium]